MADWGPLAPAPTVAEASAGAEASSPSAAAAQASIPAPTVAEADSLQPSLRPSAPGAWHPGEIVLGLYQVAELLGEGGMGRVYRVRHRGWGLDLAVKVPLPSLLDAAGGADLFEREAETWVGLGLHPHVVTCHYVRRIDALPIVFAEYADGGSLHDAIRAGRFDSAQKILDIAIQFAWGLHHAHEQGLVHRDVKPANVMLTHDGLAKMTDFGLARARAARTAAGTAGDAGRTMWVKGGGAATPAYVSPEQARGDALTRRSDIWSFALCVLEMFLGGRTWEFGLAAPEVLRARPKDVTPGAPDMPEAVSELLARCFRENPDDRPHDLGEVAEVLRQSWEADGGRRYPRELPRALSGSADALNNRAASLVDLARTVEAHGLWRRALGLDPHHVEATFNASLADWELARISDTELVRRTEEASASHPASSRARQLVARVHLTLDQRVEALASLERAAALGGSDEIEADRRAASEPQTASGLVLRGLAGPIAALAVTPDGRTIVAGSGRELRFWDAKSGQLLRTSTLPEGDLKAVLPLPGGGLVLAGEGAPLGLWDLGSGRLQHGFARHPGFATTLAAAPGGLVLSGGSDRIVRLWDPASGRCMREMAGHEDAVTAVAAGAAVLASAGRDGTVRLWSPAGDPVGVLRPGAGRVLALALCEPQWRLVSAGEDGVIRDWGLRSRELVRTFVSHNQAVQAVALSPDGSRIVSGSTDRTARGFEAESERLTFLARFEGAVHALVYGPDGTIWIANGSLVSARQWQPILRPPTVLCRPSSTQEEETRATAFDAQVEGGRSALEQGDLASALRLLRTARSIPGRERAPQVLRVWDALSARLPRRALLSAWEDSRFEGHEDSVLSVVVDAERARVATASADGHVRTWAIGSPRALVTCRGHEGPVTGVAFVPGLDQLLSCGRDRTVRLWDGAQGRLLATFEGHSEPVAAVDVTPSGFVAASAGWDGTVRLWQLRRRSVVHVLADHHANVAAVRFSLDGQVLASAGWDGTARLWDAESGASLAVLAGHSDNVTAVALHPGGRLVATGSEDRMIRLFDPRAARPPRVLTGHEGEITGLAFTSDGRFLISSSRDKTVRVWDVRQGHAVRTLPHPAMVLGLALATTGSQLVTASADRSARIWHLDWEPDPNAVDGPNASTPTTTTRATTPLLRAATVRATTLRADLRRNAGPARLRPRAHPGVAAVRRLSGRWIALGAFVLVATLASLLSWWRPAPRLRLSPHVVGSVPSVVDPIDVRAFVDQCSAADYERHLEAWRSGEPSAVDVACVGARGSAGMVEDVLQLPLSSPLDPLQTARMQRNALSAVIGVSGESLERLCGHLSDDRDEVRGVVGLALGSARDPAANDCVSETLLTGSATTKMAAATALRLRIARGLVPIEEGWRLLGRLLRDPDPAARIAALQVVPLFTSPFAEPAVRELLADPDEEVRAAARGALESVTAIRRIDLLRGDDGR